MAKNDVLPLRAVHPPLGGFNPFRDLSDVDQTGFIDLSDAYTRGVIPGVIQPSDDTFNNISDPDMVLPRSDDAFAAIRTASYVVSELERREKSAKANGSHKVADVQPSE